MKKTERPWKVEKIVELKLSGLGFRAIGKQVELNKDKVREIWLKCEKNGDHYGENQA